MLSRTKIFISYRRSDSPAMCDRIYQWLAKRFGAATLFKDIDTIPLGVDFAQAVRNAISQSAVVIVIIGKTWLTTTDGSGRWRLDNPNDFVRQEVELALQQNVPVIPLFVDGAMMPAAAALPPTLRPLTLRNGRDVHYDPYFTPDMRRVCRDIEPWVKTPPIPTPSYMPPVYQASPRMHNQGWSGYPSVMPRPAWRATLRARLFANALPIFQQMRYIAIAATVVLVLCLIVQLANKPADPSKADQVYKVFSYVIALPIFGGPLIASFIVARQTNLWRWGVKGAALLGMAHACVSLIYAFISTPHTSYSLFDIASASFIAVLVLITVGVIYTLVGMLGAAAGKLSLRVPSRSG